MTHVNICNPSIYENSQTRAHGICYNKDSQTQKDGKTFQRLVTVALAQHLLKAPQYKKNVFKN